MAVSQTSEGYALPCGRQLEELWESLENGTAGVAGLAGLTGVAGSHEQTCPHCLTALSGLVALRDATRELAAEPVDVPPRLTNRIMAAIRADVRRTRMLPLPEDGLEPGGQADVSAQAVAAVLRFAADAVPGIRARRCSVRPRDPAAAPDGMTGWVDVEMTLAIRYGTASGEQVLAAVRQAVLAAAGAQIGLRVARCDLLVDDVWFAASPGED
ncbi:MAG TPA: Asp23/Gls24 family envelope stress response protein [Trebonia sp.]|jgi:hypothetical protein|nr:Asp23/Gls24 family envelope stress response protein [Trebonia sp.]